MKKNAFYRHVVLAVCLVLLVTVLGESPVRAAAPFDPSSLVFREATSGLTQPIFLANAGDGSGRLVIVERAGRIWLFEDGNLLPTPFPDIPSIVNDTGPEQRLLTLAFHPNYETNGQFFTVSMMIPRADGRPHRRDARPIPG